MQRAPRLRALLQRVHPRHGGCTTSYWVDARGYEHFGARGSSPWHTVRWRYYAAGAGVVGFSYYWSSRETIPYSHRHHAIMFVTQGMERRMGEAMFDQVKEEARQQKGLMPDGHPFVQQVRRVGMNIARVAVEGHGGGNYEHMKDMRWEFAVIHSPEVNAFVLPGGKVVVFSGLLRLMGNEDELAAVLGHETGHVLARHHAERISRMSIISAIQMLVYLLLGIPIPEAFITLGMFLPHSRAAEYEADRIGLNLMALACYDPGANPSMLDILYKQEQIMDSQVAGRGVKIPTFLRTHPLTTDRIKRVQQQLPEAYRVYHSQNCNITRSYLNTF